jgi:hypothetical protein
VARPQLLSPSTLETPSPPLGQTTAPQPFHSGDSLPCPWPDLSFLALPLWRLPPLPLARPQLLSPSTLATPSLPSPWPDKSFSALLLWRLPPLPLARLQLLSPSTLVTPSSPPFERNRFFCCRRRPPLVRRSYLCFLLPNFLDLLHICFS